MDLLKEQVDVDVLREPNVVGDQRRARIVHRAGGVGERRIEGVIGGGDITKRVR